MDKNPIFAVVDLETTGSSLNDQNRIIQFSCVLLENGKIIDTFNTFINPRQTLSPEIKQLTNISDATLQKAPYFDDLAATIYALLQNTIFVAHNVRFDFSFLNYELQAAGYPALEIPAIDTVQLAQILFPTQASYRLNDLAQNLKIKHTNPHQADSDTKVTAQLFLALINKAKKLPHQVQKQLCHLSNCLIYETGTFFSWILTNYPNSKDLAKDLIQVEQLVLKREQLATATINQQIYPTTITAKKKLFANKLETRIAQFVLMDDIHTFFEDNKQSTLVIEAPTGIGKTLGYLLPASHIKKPVLISTATTALQAQLQQDLNFLNQILKTDLTAVVVKSAQNYIDLQAFNYSLTQVQTKQARLLQMRLLVWLLTTTTGDFAELNLTTLHEPLFVEIAHQAHLPDKQSPFYAVDFLIRQLNKQQYADFLITNHAYLLNHVEELASFASNLIIDEAQNFALSATKFHRQTLDLDQIKILADSLLVKMESKSSYSFKNLITLRFITNSQAQQLISHLQIVDHEIEFLRQKLFTTFIIKAKTSENTFEISVNPNKLKGFLKENYHLIQKISKAWNNFEILNSAFEQQFYQNGVDQLDSGARTFLYDYFTLSTQLKETCLSLKNLVLTNFEKIIQHENVWFSYSTQNPNAHLKLKFGKLTNQNYLSPNIYSQFNKTLLIGAGLILPDNLEYTRSNFDLPATTQLLQYPEIFNYQTQAAGFFVSDAPDINHCLPQIATNYLNQVLAQIISQTTKQTLILFNSLEAIKECYTYLAEQEYLKKRIILAQGITGGNEKIKKRFVLDKHKHCVLLATGTFWEGIDFPKDQLELLIITRLPFQALQQDYNQIRYQNARRLNQDPFITIALPEAILKFKQGVGRLIRTPNDYGALVVLDSRIFTRNYGTSFLNVLPPDLTVKKCLTAELTTNLKTFFKNN